MVGIVIAVGGDISACSDLKPANCLIAENGYLRIADLGLAKDVRQGGKAYSKVCFHACELRRTMSHGAAASCNSTRLCHNCIFGGGFDFLCS